MLGPCFTWHLAGGLGGMRHAMEHWSPEEGDLWTHLKAPAYTPELIDAMADGCEQMQRGRDIRDVERRRDRCLIAIQSALDAFWYGRDEDGWPEAPS
jgi:carnitine 3-dehydrogenase